MFCRSKEILLSAFTPNTKWNRYLTSNNIPTDFPQFSHRFNISIQTFQIVTWLVIICTAGKMFHNMCRKKAKRHCPVDVCKYTIRVTPTSSVTTFINTNVRTAIMPKQQSTLPYCIHIQLFLKYLSINQHQTLINLSLNLSFMTTPVNAYNIRHSTSVI